MENQKILNSVLPFGSITRKFTMPVKFTEYGIGRTEYLVRKNPMIFFK